MAGRLIFFNFDYFIRLFSPDLDRLAHQLAGFLSPDLAERLDLTVNLG